MATPFRSVTINFTPVRIVGFGGVPILALVVLMAVVFPIVRWVLVLGAISGGIVAATMIRARRNRDRADPGGGCPKVLFRDPPAPTPGPRTRALRVGGKPVELAA